jgi:hypothetical protein
MDKYEIPKQLIEALDVSQLQLLLAHLNRTRRRFYPFALNGRMVMTTRKWARDAVAAELAARPSEPNRLPSSDPLGVWATPPGKRRAAVRA